MNEFIMGIDPGKHGAISLLKCDDCSIELIEDMSLLSDGNVDYKKLYESLNRFSTFVDHVFIEHITAVFGRGSIATCSLCGNYQALIALSIACSMTVMSVTPQLWKRYFGLIGVPKDESRLLAIQYFPEHAEFFSRKKDNDRAESCLIGMYGLSLL